MVREVSQWSERSIVELAIAVQGFDHAHWLNNWLNSGARNGGQRVPEAYVLVIEPAMLIIAPPPLLATAAEVNWHIASVFVFFSSILLLYPISVLQPATCDYGDIDDLRQGSVAAQC